MVGSLKPAADSLYGLSSEAKLSVDLTMVSKFSQQNSKMEEKQRQSYWHCFSSHFFVSTTASSRFEERVAQ